MSTLLNAEIDSALAYVDSYVEKNPDILAPIHLPNESDDFEAEVYEKSVEFLSESYCKAVGG